MKKLFKYLKSFLGGETIKGISQQSGARIELQRNPPPNADPNIKMFTVRGSPQQIDYARQLVEEKIGVRHWTVILRWGHLFVLCLFTDLTLCIYFSGTRHSCGWPTWSPWATWRPRPTWSSWTTWAPRCTHGTVQPWTIQPGTARTAVSTVTRLFHHHLHWSLVLGTLGCRCRMWKTDVCFILPSSVVLLHLISLRGGAMATHTGNKANPIQVSI